MQEYDFCRVTKQKLSLNEFYHHHGNDGKIRYLYLHKNVVKGMIDEWYPYSCDWIFKILNIPFIGSTWWDLKARYGALPVLGRYIALMGIDEFKNYGYNDTEQLNEVKYKETKEKNNEYYQKYS